MTKLYFAYGSNLWLEQMQNRCPSHRVIGAGILENYRWIISKRGYANIVKSADDEVQGVVSKLFAFFLPIYSLGFMRPSDVGA
jgi:gamma-glutamylcyclotransferase